MKFFLFSLVFLNCFLFQFRRIFDNFLRFNVLNSKQDFVQLFFAQFEILIKGLKYFCFHIIIPSTL